ncbi:MAG: membrane protein insertion efficiency factor YidD [Candidatus Omnitrophica bacterium]|nr:membrane protein insertion efficiency factor YidD [Candidatus Omnitrophota bacterium]MCM8809552.1 membrane protein insertion efficiency factor YidD [Candidatus Omnitrophota bacterium]MCM8833396.1 membrane protein insertion efficiency factor YidD [Candidatus Omnitrophota bacterium]
MKLIIKLIRVYQILFSPLLGNICRFYPSCSNFMIQAIEKKGFKGIFIGIKRILRCHPFNKGGYDPIEKWIK